MIKSYLKMAFNNLLQQKLYSAINILGLAVGLASCLLIGLFVLYETNYDHFFTDSESIYRVSPDFATSALGAERHPAGNVAPLAPLIKRNNIEGLKDIARIGGQNVLISNNDLAFNEENFRWADNEIFTIFEFHWLQGDPVNALMQPASLVITESIANKYFGETDPMGQTLMLENNWPLTITGVIKNIPENSHLSADFFVPMETAWKLLDFSYENNWSYTNFHTYLRLEPGAEIESVLNSLAAIVNASIDVDLAGFFNINSEAFGFTAYQLSDIHLHSARPGEFKEAGSLYFIYTFSAIAFFILLIACINFMNLSTAHSSKRAVEVGLRKTIGANRAELIKQFLGESLLLTIIAALIAVMLVEILLPVFSSIINADLTINYFSKPEYVFIIAGITLLTGLSAGSYPAFYLSSFKPAEVFKTQRFGSRSSYIIRNLLVVFQFFLAITLIVASIVVFLQMQYARNIDVGFNKEQMLILSGTNNDGLGNQWQALKQELKQHPEIAQITEGDMSPRRLGSRRVRIEGGDTGGFDMLAKGIGFNFFDAYDIKLVAGRDFNEGFSTDIFYPPPSRPVGSQLTGSYVLNETAIREMGMTPEEIIGKKFELDFSSDFSLAISGPVIGVVEDVNFQSLREPIQALVYFVPYSQWGNLPSFNSASVRISGNNTTETIAYIKQKWHMTTPEIPLIYHFLDTDFDALYYAEEQQGKLFTLFSGLTIIISCLGLFGLAVFTSERRKKEIGVRKVMGGSVWSIVLLLTNDFSKLVLISNLLAWPLGYFFMENWLENFAYRIDLTPLIFIGSGLIALCIAWVTVGGTAAKAANTKPVLALRYE